MSSGATGGRRWMLTLLGVGLDFDFLVIQGKRCPNLTDIISYFISYIRYLWDGLKPLARTVLRRSTVTHDTWSATWFRGTLQDCFLILYIMRDRKSAVPRHAQTWSSLAHRTSLSYVAYTLYCAARYETSFFWMDYPWQSNRLLWIIEHRPMPMLGRFVPVHERTT